LTQIQITTKKVSAGSNVRPRSSVRSDVSLKTCLRLEDKQLRPCPHPWVQSPWPCPWEKVLGHNTEDWRALGRTDTASALGRCKSLPTPKARQGKAIPRTLVNCVHWSILIYYRQFERKTEKVLYISYCRTETCDAGNRSPLS